MSETSKILAKPYARIIMPDGDGWFGTILEFPGCMVLEPTPAMAAVRLERVADGWLRACLENGRPIPEPIGFDAILEQQKAFRARAALSAIQGKYVVLPREPNKAIQDALIDAVRDGIAINDDIHRTARHAYRAMIREGEIK